MMQKLFLLIQQFGQRCLKEQTCRNVGERVAQLLGLTQWSGKRPRQIHTSQLNTRSITNPQTHACKPSDGVKCQSNQVSHAHCVHHHWIQRHVVNTTLWFQSSGRESFSFNTQGSNKSKHNKHKVKRPYVVINVSEVRAGGWNAGSSMMFTGPNDAF